MSLLLAPAEIIYRSSMQRRRQAMLERRQTETAPCPIVSVGNITVGGTGKTPMVQWTAAYLQELGYQVAVVARGYGGTLSDHGAIVSRGGDVLHRAGEVGDEPVLHARNLPGVAVVIAKDRHWAVQQAVTECRADIVVLDDGFQFWSLPRVCDIVLLDARAPLGNGRLLPVGRLREEPTALSRADALLLTRSDAASAVELDHSRATIRTCSNAPIFLAEHGVDNIRSEISEEMFSLRVLKDKPFVLLSAIANNDSFRQSALAAGAEVVAHEARRDHHHWTKSEIAGLVKRWQGEIAGFLTTEKDATKIDPAWMKDLNSPWGNLFPLASLRIRLRVRQNEDELKRLIAGKLKTA